MASPIEDYALLGDLQTAAPRESVGHRRSAAVDRRLSR
jgi:hypothetical protein